MFGYPDETLQSLVFDNTSTDFTSYDGDDNKTDSKENLYKNIADPLSGLNMMVLDIAFSGKKYPKA